MMRMIESVLAVVAGIVLAVVAVTCMPAALFTVWGLAVCAVVGLIGEERL